MKTCTFTLVVVALALSSAPAFSQQVSLFHEHPSARQALIDKLKNRASKDRKNAEAWAKAHGKPTRFERNGKTYHLAAVRNGKPCYRVTHNAVAGSISKANQVWIAPYNLNGAGITVGVWDAGEALTSHQEFGGRITYMSGETEPAHYHATHVGGTIGATGVLSSAKGMAPAVSINSYDWWDDFSEMTSAGATAAGQPAKLYLSNHSYGYGRGWEDGTFHGYEEFGQYNYYASQADVIVAGHAYYLPFFSAGNDRDDGADGTYKSGYDNMADYAIAKNVMTVGAVNDSKGMSSFSSWGPCDDGRIKPDIVANGVGLNSTWHTGDADYYSISGTSMSSPSACGSAALLVEYYKELFPPNGAMRASTLKGLIIHTADDLGRPGPDYSYGWGLMNTKAAADLLRNYAAGNVMKLTEATVTPSQRSDTYQFQWNGVDPIRVTLCWTDPAGSTDSDNDNRAADLVNDLDLKITGPGDTYYPYKLSYTSPTANATATSENNVDNVEQVYIASPSAGMYTITVDYDGTLDQGNTQWYSLLVSGNSGDADADGIPDAWESLYFGGATNALPEGDLDGDGSDNLTEYIAGTLPNDANSVFKVTTHSAPVSGNSPFIVTWNPVEGRVYNVSWNTDLLFGSFTNISGDLPYPAGSYTDSVERASPPNFYRIDVKLAE